MTYSIEQIQQWAKEGQAISPNVAFELLDEVKRLEAEIAFLKDHAKYLRNERDALREQLSLRGEQ